MNYPEVPDSDEHVVGAVMTHHACGDAYKTWLASRYRLHDASKYWSILFSTMTRQKCIQMTNRNELCLWILNHTTSESIIEDASLVQLKKPTPKHHCLLATKFYQPLGQ